MRIQDHSTSRVVTHVSLRINVQESNLGREVIDYQICRQYFRRPYPKLFRNKKRADSALTLDLHFTMDNRSDRCRSSRIQASSSSRSHSRVPKKIEWYVSPPKTDTGICVCCAQVKQDAHDALVFLDVSRRKKICCFHVFHVRSVDKRRRAIVRKQNKRDNTRTLFRS